MTLPDGLEYISRAAFENCTSLKSITLPKGLTEIDDIAFRNCKSLTTVIMPTSILSCGYQVFYGLPDPSIIIVPNHRVQNIIAKKVTSKTKIFVEGEITPRWVKGTQGTVYLTQDGLANGWKTISGDHVPIVGVEASPGPPAG
ncbi:MAG: leucine-rich repeat domain-containing protein, partial [Eggerthellaceae bacterium]